MKKKVLLLLSLIAVLAVFTFSLTAYAADDIGTTSIDGSVTQNAIDISSPGFSAALAYSSVNYSGEARTPKAVLTYNKAALAEGIDYDLEYINNVNAGTASVRFTGKGNYTGTLTKTFTINRLSFSSKKLSVTLSTDFYTYSGEGNKPNVTATYKIGDTVIPLTEGVDFKVSYSKNINPGKAAVKISGMGNYKDSVSKPFYILPQTVKGIKTTNIKTNSLTLSWDKVTGASGYQIFKFNPKKGLFEHYKFVTGNSVFIQNVSSGSNIKFQVRAYKTIDKSKYYGNLSKVKDIITKPSQVVITSVTKNSNKIEVEWKPVKCTGYRLYYSTDKEMKKNVKEVKVSSSSKSYTIKKINKSKHYYVKIRPYVTYNGKTVNGSISTMMGSYFSNVYASYSSKYVNNANRTTNLRIASKKINGTIIQPGETFSFNKVVGPRTAKRGYKAAPIFSGQNSVENGTGGGICQVASTLFNCALKANVTITERHQHSQRVSYVPLGRDAAIYSSVEDFKWTNNTKYPIQIKMKVENGIISCSFNTCSKAKPKSVKLKVTSSGRRFTLNRIVAGKSNYRTSSTY